MSEIQKMFTFSNQKKGQALGDFVCFTMPLLFIIYAFVVSVEPYNTASSRAAYFVCLAALILMFVKSLLARLRVEHYHFSERGVTITRQIAMWKKKIFIPLQEVDCCEGEDAGRNMFGASRCIFFIKMKDQSKLRVRAIFRKSEVEEMVQNANSALHPIEGTLQL